jgi:putative transposase
MEAAIYKSYPTCLKWEVLNGKETQINYNTKYYWKNKGKTKIENANALMEPERTHKGNEINKLLPELFNFFMQLLDTKTIPGKLYKKDKAPIISLIEQLKPFVGLETICNWFKITERTYYNWKNKIICKVTVSKQCPNVYPLQITDAERRIIEQDYFYNEKYLDYSVADLYALLLRHKKVFVSEGLFYKMAGTLGEIKKRKWRRRKKYAIGIRAKRVFEIIHMDKTCFVTADNKRVWAHLICDNKSRAVLGCKISLSSHSKITLCNLRCAVNKYDLLKNGFTLISDDGSENKGEVKKFVILHKKIKHKIAQLDISSSNSMIESVIKQLKYRYLKNEIYKSAEDLEKGMVKAIYEYNNRAKIIHMGKTPQEILGGHEINFSEWEDYKFAIRQNRLKENRNFNCLKAMYGFKGTEKIRL